MGEPAQPSDRERDGRRAIARAIVEAVRNDEACPVAPDNLLLFQLAQEIVMLQDSAIASKTIRAASIGDGTVLTGGSRSPITIAAVMKMTTVADTLECTLCRHGRAAHGPKGCTVTAISSYDSDCGCAGYRQDHVAKPGDLVFVELPLNCSVHDLPGAGPGDLVRIIDSALKVGEHWDNQDGINAAYLDELAEATRVRRGG